ncbi:MAG TPA: LmeA family phospholipid-binding protein [bacterium]|nr:LmeA family phospholipid-binding protein [bacterium]
MSRLAALLAAILLVVIAPAVLLSWQLSSGLRRETQARASVRVVAAPWDVARGRIWRLQFTVRRVAVAGATARELRGVLRDVRLDVREALAGRLEIRGLSGGRIVVVVDETDVERYLAGARDIQRPDVRLDGGLVRISGSVHALNALFPIEVTAQLAIERGALVLRVRELQISGVAIPSHLGNVLMTAVNPLLLPPRQPVPVRFTGVTVHRGRAVITGEPAP